MRIFIAIVMLFLSFNGLACKTGDESDKYALLATIESLSNVSLLEQPISYVVKNGKFYVVVSNPIGNTAIYLYENEKLIKQDTDNADLSFFTDYKNQILRQDSLVKFIISEYEYLLYKETNYSQYSLFHVKEGNVEKVQDNIGNFCYYDKEKRKLYLTNGKNLISYDAVTKEIENCKFGLERSKYDYYDFVRVVGTNYFIIVAYYNDKNSIKADIFLKESLLPEKCIDEQKKTLSIVDKRLKETGYNDTLPYINAQSLFASVNILKNNIELKDAPNGESIGKLYEGAVVNIEYKEKDWVRVSGDGAVGWITKDNIIFESLFDEILHKANSADKIAQYMCAMVYKRFDYRSPKSIEMLELSSKQGYLPAKGELSLMYCNLGIKEYKTKALPLISEVIKAGYLKYAYNLGSIYFEVFNLPLTYRDLTQLLADDGYAKAQVGLAGYYYGEYIRNGRYSVNDSREGLFWLQKAAKQGNDFAIDMLNNGGTGAFFIG
ncbi:SH3 domain-containing protein [Endomicrobium proavitum]|uniref:Putative Acetyltransferase (GNAT) family protein n=1 Tax=Endomicrobium proavitum TaxID=1408281 RepID=A0A0G3WKN6_9BACT|nr:SH3 domain-containing protein [Endomicrobium proavitum]AKL98029.1 putative Acetyltransferase (GNAT) family protein [Endomicrobium proavitum]